MGVVPGFATNHPCQFSSPKWIDEFNGSLGLHGQGQRHCCLSNVDALLVAWTVDVTSVALTAALTCVVPVSKLLCESVKGKVLRLEIPSTPAPLNC